MEENTFEDSLQLFSPDTFLTSHVHLAGATPVTVTMAVSVAMSVRISFRFRFLRSAKADLRDLLFVSLLCEVCEVAVGGPGEAVTVSVAAAVLVEQAEADQVDDESHGAHPQDHLRIVNFFRLVEPFQTFDSNRETESNQKDGIDEGAQHLGSGPAEGVLGPGLGSHSHAEESDDQSCDVRQHVETVGHKCHGICEVT